MHGCQRTLVSVNELKTLERVLDDNPIVMMHFGLESARKMMKNGSYGLNGIENYAGF